MLGFAAERQNRSDSETDPGRQRDVNRRVDGGELLHRDAERREVGARTAQIFGDEEAEQAELAHLAHDVGGEHAFLVPFGGFRGEDLVREVPHDGTERVLFGTEVEVHWASLSNDR